MDHEAEMIRDQMQETRGHLTEKLQALESQVTGTVETVTDTVKSTVETVKDSVEGAVESVANLFDLRLQVQRHPWGVFAGGVAVGYVATRLAERATGAQGGTRFVPQVPPAARKAGSSLLGWLATAYHDEMNHLKALGIGTAAGLVRDMLAQSLPPEIGCQVSEWVDN